MRFIILRAVSGSGKSTLARNLIGAETDQMAKVMDLGKECRYLFGHFGVTLSTDLYFLDHAGNYVFDGSKIAEYHQRNFKTCESFMKLHTELIVLDNTNIQHWHFAHYVRLAYKMGYQIEFMELPPISVEEAVARNVHNLPRKVIEDQIRNFEPLDLNKIFVNKKAA